MPDGGRMIVIGSTNGDRMPFAGGAAYALSKSAIQGMVRGLDATSAPAASPSTPSSLARPTAT